MLVGIQPAKIILVHNKCKLFKIAITFSRHVKGNIFSFTIHTLSPLRGESSSTSTVALVERR